MSFWKICPNSSCRVIAAKGRTKLCTIQKSTVRVVVVTGSRCEIRSGRPAVIECDITGANIAVTHSRVLSIFKINLDHLHRCRSERRLCCELENGPQLKAGRYWWQEADKIEHRASWGPKMGKFMNPITFRQIRKAVGGLTAKTGPRPGTR